MRFSLLSVCLFAMSSCTQGPVQHYETGSVWGTTYNIKYTSNTSLSDSIIRVMHDIDMSLSPFAKGSFISDINAGKDVMVDSMLVDMIELSRYLNGVSEGMFDPTIAPLINLWGFGYSKGAEDCPTETEIQEALSSVGIMDCMVDSTMHLIRKSKNTEFNFSAIAKGYGVDKIAEMLRRNGCIDYMVEVGGEIALSGNGPSGDKWNIQIDAPIIETGAVSHTRLDRMHLTDACIATSGNYRNHRSTSQGEVGHTISPITGCPILTNTLSVTVIAPTTALADGLATSAMAMSDTAAIKMLESIPEVSALIVLADSIADYRIVTTGSFDKFTKVPSR